MQDTTKICYFITMKDNSKIKKQNNAIDDIHKYVNNVLRENESFFEENLKELDISQYSYDPKEALDELGIELELINQLIEDYVTQIVKSKDQFVEYLKDMKDNKEFDYTPLRELAHKNLGVARNLRIKDGRKILEEIMKEDDLDHLILCVIALEYAAIRLKPTCAYETLRLMEIKSSFHLAD